MQQRENAGSWERREFTRTPGGATTHGQQFEYGLASLLCLRSLHSSTGRFLLGSNLAGLGQFDDIFLKLGSQACFLQLKHKDKGGRVTRDQLLQPRGSFSVSKYFESYCLLEDTSKGLTDNPNSDVIRETNFQMCMFVLYTNSFVDHKSKTMDINEFSIAERILSTGNLNEEIFSFGPEDEEIWNLRKDYEDSARFHAFLARFRIYSGQSDVHQLRLLLKEEVGDCAQVKGKDAESLSSSFLGKMEKWWNKENTFLSQVCPQWNQVLLEDLNLKMILKLQDVNYRFEQGSCGHLDVCTDREAFLNITVPGVKSNIRCLKIFAELETKYSGRYLLMDANYVIQRKRQVLFMCQKRFCDVLVINEQARCDLKLVTTNLCPELYTVVIVSERKVDMGCRPCRYHEDQWSLDQLTKNSQKRILETEVTFQGETVCLKELSVRGIFHEIGGKVLDTLLQGHPVSVGSALAAPEELYIPRTLRHQTALREDALRVFHQDDIFAVSGCPPDRQSADDFHSVDFDQSTDTNMISTIILSRAGSKTSQFSAARGDHPDRNKYLDLCSKYKSQKAIHWVLYEDGFLLWKESCGNEATPSQYTVRLSSSCGGVADCCHEAGVQVEWTVRLLLVIGEPGMGKSTLLNHISAETKHNTPASWVVHVALSNFTKALHNLSAESLTLQNIYDILAEAAGVGTSTCPEFAKRLLLNSLEGGGKSTVLLDAVDEISPTYFNQVLRIVQLLLGTKLIRLWVTSRTVLQEHLQRKLSVLPLVLEPFSEEDQHCFLSQYFDKQTTHINVDNILRLIEHIRTKRGAPERHICDVPLHARMIADTIHKLLQGSPESTSYSEMLHQLNLYRLYDRFISRKREYYYEKCGIDTRIPALIGNAEREDDYFTETHIKCALLVVFSPEECDALNISNIETEVKPFLERIEMEKTGIIDGTINGQPKFVHFTFAEFLVAKWFFKCYEDIPITSNVQHETRKNITKRLSGIIRKMRKVFGAFKSNGGSVRGKFEMLFADKCGLVQLFFDQMLSEGYELHDTVLTGDTKLVRETLESGASVDCVDRGGRLALHLAAAHGHSEISRSLLAAGSPVSLPCNVLIWSPLRYADRAEAWGVAEQLLQHGACVSDLVSLKNKDSEEAVGSILIGAAIHGKIELVGLLLKLGANVHVSNSDGWTALYYAALRGHIQMVQLLLAHKADINCTTKYGSTPLMRAANTGHLETVQMLLARGANVHVADCYGSTALMGAALNGHTEVVELLSVHKADINCTSQLWGTPLVCAVSSGHLETVHTLLSLGANVHVANGSGDTALICAALNGHTKVARLLLDHKADIEGTNKQGNTPLICAAYHGHIQTVQLLLARGANVKFANNEGETAINSAARRGHEKVVRLLLTSGATEDAANTLGNNLVQTVARCSYSGGGCC